MDLNGQGADRSHSRDFEDGVLNLGSNEFAAAFGESLEDALDIKTWCTNYDFAEAHERLEREVTESVARENENRNRIRNEIFPLIFSFSQAPSNAGCYQAQISQIERIQRGLLFNGAVEACDGISMVHDGLALTVAQIGVSTISYQGDSGSWMQRLYRRDLRVKGESPIAEVMSLLQRRAKDPRAEGFALRDVLSQLSRRAIMTFAEHSVLLHKCKSPWRMGHGTPTPHELLTGAGLLIDGEMPLLQESLKLWSKLLIEHKKWLFVSSSPRDDLMLTLGNALHPLEFAFVDTARQVMLDVIDHVPRPIKDEAEDFIEEIGSKIVVGVYRASQAASPCVFYAHEEYAYEAAMIAIADSALREHHGFPMLLDLADQVCRTAFGGHDFENIVQQAYIQADAPFNYLRGRRSRI